MEAPWLLMADGLALGLCSLERGSQCVIVADAKTERCVTGVGSSSSSIMPLGYMIMQQPQLSTQLQDKVASRHPQQAAFAAVVAERQLSTETSNRGYSKATLCAGQLLCALLQPWCVPVASSHSVLAAEITA